MKNKETPYDIFLSYATEDEPYVSELSDSLTYLGLRVWFAPLSLEIGDRLLDSINAGLNMSKYGIVVLSPAYINKQWTKYEIDILHRQHIEGEKKLFPLWHGIEKNELDSWNPGLSGIIALKSSIPLQDIAKKISNVISKNAPIRGVAPSYENPQWRFLQGRGELLSNTIDGPAFNIFEAAEFPDEDFPLYIHGQSFSKKEIIKSVAKCLGFNSYDEIRISRDRLERLGFICKTHGYDINDPNFDPATII